VPATAVTGRVTVTTPGGSATSAADFVVIRPPTVTGFTPARGTSGTVVTISGTNLGSAIAVAFGGGVDAGAITVLSSTSIRVRLPAGALTGRITVVNDAGTAQSAGTFVVVPAISGTGMPSGPTGLPVSILGAGFTGATVVKFGPAIAQFTIVSDGEVSAIVPATAVTGRVSVTTPGGVATSPADFVVTAPGGS
jgi:hypothetical protein